MPTSTDIVNVALRRIGATRIASLSTDGTKEAIAARDLYDEARRELLASHAWNFATKRQRLQSSVVADIADTPAAGYAYAYVLPEEALRLVSVHASESDDVEVPYKLEFQEDSDRVILCDATEIYIKYIFDLEDANVMGAVFRDALAWRLARDLAAALAKSASTAELAAGQFARQLSRAKSVDGVEDYPDRMAEGSWATSRFGSTNPFG